MARFKWDPEKQKAIKITGEGTTDDEGDVFTGEGMTDDELRQFAVEKGIDISANISRRETIIKAIQQGLTAVPQ